jgi:tetratricopeptide (TPR) repeat protein
MQDRITQIDHDFFGGKGKYLLVLAAVCIPFLLTLGNPLVMDAQLAVTANRAVHVEPLSEIFTVDFWGFPLDSDYATRSWRPLVSLSYALQARLLGSAPALFHLADLLLHAVAAMLVLLLFESLGLRSRWAIVGAMLFAIHPAQTEAVASVVGRADIMAAMFFLAALILHLKAEGRNRPWLLEGPALLALAAAFLCKEYAVAFPFILVAIDYARHRGEGKKINWPFWAGGFAILAAYLLLRYSLTGGLGGVPMMTAADHPLHDAPLTTRWSMAARLLLLAGRLVVAPVWLNHHYRFGTLPIVEHLWDPRALAGIALFAVAFGAAIWWLRRRRSAVPLISALLFFLPLLPALNIVSLGGVLFAERFLYLPLAGALLLICWTADLTIKEKRFGIPAVAAVGLLLLLFAVMSISRVGDWKSEERLADSSLAHYPNGSEVWMQLGLAVGAEGRNDEAIEALERSLAIQPEQARAWQAYGAALVNAGRFAEGAKAYRRCLELAPQEIGALWRGLGDAEMRAGNLEQALEAFGRASAASPWDPAAALLQGQALMRAGRPEEAVVALRQSLGTVQADKDAVSMMLGQALLRSGQEQLQLGGRTEAIALATEAVGLDVLPAEGTFLAGLLAIRSGNHILARQWFDLALSQDPDLLRKKHAAAMKLQEEERHQEASVLFREILAADPDHAPTLFNLGRTLLLIGQPQAAMSPLQRGLELVDDPRAREMLATAVQQVRAKGSGLR